MYLATETSLWGALQPMSPVLPTVAQEKWLKEGELKMWHICSPSTPALLQHYMLHSPMYWKKSFQWSHPAQKQPFPVAWAHLHMVGTSHSPGPVHAKPQAPWALYLSSALQKGAKPLLVSLRQEEIGIHLSLHS